MTTQEAIQAVYLKATGKTTTLTTGSKYSKILALLDFYQRRWAREPGVDWFSLYNPAYSLGTISETDTYDLDSTIKNLSGTQGDTVRIMWADGVGVSDYDIVDPDKLKDYYYGQNKESSLGKYCAQIGNTLVFNHTFTTTDPESGGDIQVPCYTHPEPLTNASGEEIQVDDPDWLVLRCAAEFVRTDLTRQNQYNNLLDEANEAMGRMIDDNAGQIDEVNRPWTPDSGLGDSAWS